MLEDAEVLSVLLEGEAAKAEIALLGLEVVILDVATGEVVDEGSDDVWTLGDSTMVTDTVVSADGVEVADSVTVW